jgi:aminoglycoside 3-N-acetyltransferase
MNIRFDDIRHAVRALDLSDRSLCVHSSLRSFGWVDGGASAIVEGLLAEGCTVLVPTFTYVFAVEPLPHQRPARNGWNYDSPPHGFSGGTRVYTIDTTEIQPYEMGAIPAAVVERPERVRGNHPLCSFSAVGPLAADLVGGQAPLHVYAPLEELVRRDGAVALMGVGLDKMTLLHLAEQVAGRALFRRWANGPDGLPMEVETGGCSEGFPNLEPILSPLEKRTNVGLSTWRVFRAGATLRAAARAIRRDPHITHCGRAGCDRCNDAVLGGPLLPLPAPGHGDGVPLRAEADRQAPQTA